MSGVGRVRRFLIIGLGSMGKRRIRNLKTLGISDITGFDGRADRREEAERDYGIATVADLDSLDGYDALVISTSPESHNQYIRRALNCGKSCFVELSLLVQDLPELCVTAQSKGILVAPSCTFRFHPSIRLIGDLVKSGTYGSVTNFSYHSGQYLPDWHPWEHVGDFFVSKKDTSGCKELLSFELHWLIDLFGYPLEFAASRSGSMRFGVDIDDSYGAAMRFGSFLGTMMVDVVSRFATRSLIVNLERAQIRWSSEGRRVSVYDALEKRWTDHPEPEVQVTGDCATTNGENMYVEELRAFIAAVQGTGTYPLCLAEDIRMLRLIESMEADRLLQQV